MLKRKFSVLQVNLDKYLKEPLPHQLKVILDLPDRDPTDHYKPANRSLRNVAKNKLLTADKSLAYCRMACLYYAFQNTNFCFCGAKLSDEHIFLECSWFQVILTQAAEILLGSDRIDKHSDLSIRKLVWMSLASLGKQSIGDQKEQK